MGFIQTAAIASVLLGAATATPHYAPPSNETVHYTTEVVTHLTTYCPGATTLTYGDKTYTVTKATTLTIEDCSCTITKPVATGTGYAAPPKPTHAGGDCAEMCSNKYDDCRVAPDANMATCAAEYAACLNYNPWESGKFVKPTACHAGGAKTTGVPCTTETLTKVTTFCPEKTTLTYGNQTIPVTKPGTVTVTGIHHVTTVPIKPTGYAPPATPSTPAESKDCAEMCSDKYNKCRVAPDANMSFCAATYSECLGYSPFNAEGSLVTPTVCHGAPAGPTGAAPPVVPTKPVGHGPGGAPPAATPTAVTAGAAQVIPAGILAVLGAVALL
ncbi:related to cell wall glycoprotein [Fusarium torulosum]|uniref:Related to cell wall glycoprotein n=1 Tax=Fusarium torulosum TaxID=33205 RepID=A0AAE8LZ31_9HYPO|nr:related to cell wall glycoprotein [Fusarium torulosum]